MRVFSPKLFTGEAMKKLISKVVLFTFLIQTIFSPLMAAELSLPQFPLQITKYVEPNVMLLIDTSGSMSTEEDGEERIEIIRSIATNLVQNNKNIRFCLARFRADQGGTILSECGSSVEKINDIVAKIANLPAAGSTPVAEAYYEVINYFAGKAPKYINGLGDHRFNDNNIYVERTEGDSGNYISPIQYRCQKNYAIVMTDGEPQLDTYFPDLPTLRREYTLNPDAGTLVGNDGNYDRKDSGIFDDGGATEADRLWGKYNYLDDIAKFAWDTDLRKIGIDNATNDITGKSFDDATNNNEFLKQNLSTFTVGFTLDTQMLRSAADYGKGGSGNGDFNGDGVVDSVDAGLDHYYQANNRAELELAFQTAIDQIAIENRSTAAPTSSSDLLSADLQLFQTRFTNSKWTGELLSYQIVRDATTGKYSVAENWAAPSGFPTLWANRVVDSALHGGSALKWENLTTAEKNIWFGGVDPQHQQRLSYIRGKTAAQIKSEFATTNFRPRFSLMGDIVNSSPVFVGRPDADSFSTVNTDLNASYATFVATYNSVASVRAEMIYVGANDGMLHGFDTAGVEKMAFVPTTVFANLAGLSRSDYSHLFYVDGSPTVADVYAKFNGSINSWRTILVGGLNRGGQGIYALDVTNPAAFQDGDDVADNARAANLFQWEFSDDTTKGVVSGTDKYIADADLGYTYSQPQIVRLNDDKYYVAVGNGYNSTEADGHQSSTGDAVLYLLDIVTGAVVKKITTGHGMAEDPSTHSIGNGLATVVGYDAGTLTSGVISGKADGRVDYIYAGDLYGNLWKFDLASDSPNDWGYTAEKNGTGTLDIDRNPVKLFTARDAAGKAQPITVQPAVHTLNSGDIMLYFGTGKLLEHTDTQAANISPQTFYGIIDESLKTNLDTSPKITARSQLLQQQIVYQNHVSFNGLTKEVRATSDNVKTGYQKGWYIDLEKPVYDASNNLTHLKEGEQVVVSARVLDNIVYFVTNFSDQDACVPPVKKNFLMTLSVKSGASIDEVIIDTDEDGDFDANDNVTYTNKHGVLVTTAISGRTGFGSQLPIIIKAGTSDSAGAKEGLICDTTKCHKLKSPPTAWKRVSWQEIRTD